MNNSIFNFPKPNNEPVLGYLPGSPERVALDSELQRQSSMVVEIPLIIDGKEIRTGNTEKVVMPHNHGHVLAIYHKAGEKEIKMAVDAAVKAHKIWSETDWRVRASIMLKIAELLATKYRPVAARAGQRCGRRSLRPHGGGAHRPSDGPAALLHQLAAPVRPALGQG